MIRASTRSVLRRAVHLWKSSSIGRFPLGLGDYTLPSPRGEPHQPATLGPLELPDGYQRDVATRLGVHPGTVTNWERNRTSPHTCMMPKLAAFLDHSLLAATRSGRG